MVRDPATGSGTARSRPRWRVIARFLPIGALLAAGAWRAGVGLDLGDGSHVVGLGMRLAQGDLPVADEMNLQALGSLPVVPFTWLWLHLVGTEGVILAARLSFVALAGLAGWLSWRALRPIVNPAVAAGAVAAALIPAPYNLTNVSYNTSPGLLLLVAACAGARAVCCTDARWAAGSGVAAVLAALCYPVMAPAAVMTVVLVVLLSRRRAVVLGCGVGVVASAGVVLAWLALVIGVDHLRETLEFTTAYQAQRVSPLARLHRARTFYASTMASPAVVVAAALAVCACVPRIPLRLRALLVAAVPLVVAARALREVPQGASIPTTGMTSGVLALVLVLVLLPPAVVWTVMVGRTARRSRNGVGRPEVVGEPVAAAGAPAGVMSVGLGALLVIAVVPLAVQVPLISALTSSSPQWGSVATATTPALCAVLAATGSLALAASARAWVVAVVTSTAVLFATHTIQPFRDPAPWRLTHRVDHGAAAGILTSDEMRRSTDQVARAVASCQEEGDSLLAYGVPAAFAFGDGPMDTNILWLGAFRGANQAGVRWIEETGREPTCVVMSTDYLRLAGRDGRSRAAADPLLRWIAPRYHVIPQPVKHLVVLRRLGR